MHHFAHFFKESLGESSFNQLFQERKKRRKTEIMNTGAAVKYLAGKNEPFISNPLLWYDFPIHEKQPDRQKGPPPLHSPAKNSPSAGPTRLALGHTANL